MNRILSSCVVWLVCATAVLPATIPSEPNSVAAQTPERQERQDVHSDAKKFMTSDATTETARKGDTLPVQEKSASDIKSNPSQPADLEENHPNPLHRRNNHPEAPNKLDENDKPHLRNESPMHHLTAESNSTPEHTTKIPPQQVAAAASMERPQPISKPTSAEGEHDWKTGLLNAVETSTGEKELKTQPQSVGASDHPKEDSIGSRKQPQSTATTALSDDSPRNTDEIATSLASSKEQLDDGKTSTKPKLAEPTPSTMDSTKQSQPASVASSSFDHDTETKNA